MNGYSDEADNWLEINNHVNVLPELNAIVVVHDGPDVREAAVVDGTFDDDGDDADEHEADLYDVCPHNGFHTTLETMHTQTSSQTIDHTKRKYIVLQNLT